MRIIRAVMSKYAFPATLVFAVGATIWGVRSDIPPAVVVVCAILCVVLPLMVLERWMPHRESWNRSLEENRVDVAHMLNTALATELFRAMTFGGLFWVAALVTNAMGGTIWPTEAPAVLQLALALAIGDFGAYWVHRSAHEGTLLWRLHAMHHTSERLHTLSSGRNHPGNAVFAYSSQVVPLAILGAPTEVLATLSVFTAVHGMLQHCNADFNHGFLNHIFATADLHRWHHSTDFEHSNTNFGSNIALWDKVFGTWSLPDTDGPERVGLEDVEMPERFWAHLASPVTME